MKRMERLFEVKVAVADTRLQSDLVFVTKTIGVAYED